MNCQVFPVFHRLLRGDVVTRWMLAILLLSAGVGLMGGCAAQTVPPDATVPTGSSTISVIARGWHTDISLPVEEVSGPLTTLERDFPGVRFMVFGFGERNYLMARNGGSGNMLAALFPSKSAILMTALRAPPTEAFADERVVTLKLTPIQVDRIATLIWQSLEQTADGSVVRLADGPYTGSVFYASNETYDAFYTCNTWTARLLHGAGFPVDSRGVLFPDQVMQPVAQIAAIEARLSQ
jgi:hypothetical protein